MTSAARTPLGLILAIALGLCLGVSPCPAVPIVPSAPAPAAVSPDSPTVPAVAALQVHIVDDATGEPVAWANLLFAGGGLLADESGTCRVPSESLRGVTTIRVVHVSYEPGEVSWSPGPVPASPVTVRLRARAHEMTRVRVDGARVARMEDETRGREVISTEAAAALPNPADDPFLLVRLLPGVSAEDVGSGFRLHGGSIDETLVRIDGMEVRSLFHGRDFGGVTGIIPLGLVQQLEVYSGAFPARLGGRTSGAIDVRLRGDGAPGWHGAVAADVTAARALVEHHGARGSVYASVREGYLDRVLDRLQDDAIVEPAYRDLLVRGTRNLGVGRTISANYLRVEDHVLYEDGIGSHFVDADYQDHYLWSGMRWLVGPDVSLRGTAFGAVSTQERRLEETRRDDRRSRRVGARVEADLVRGRHDLTAGAEAEREWSRSDLLGGTVARIRPSGEVVLTENLDERLDDLTDRKAVWLQDEWAPSARVNVNLGLRGSHDTGTHDFRIAPRVAAAWSPAGRWTFHAGWGRHVQAPSGGLTGDDHVLVLSERIQQSDHTVFGVERELGGFTIGTELWQKRFRPLDGVVTRTVDDVVESHVILAGTSQGADVSLRRDTASAHWWVAYSLGRSEWSDGSRTYSRDFDALHTLALANTYRIGRDWDVGVSYRFRTGTPYTEQTWRHANGGDWVLREGQPYSARLPDYHRVDVRVRRHFRFHGWDASCWGEALNLTNHDNVLWYGWRLREPDGSARDRAERVTRTGVPGIPSVGLEVRF